MIKFTSYNCNSIRSNIESVKELLNKNDIIFLQELMLLQNDLSILNKLNNDFKCIAAVKDKQIDDIVTGRPSKGVAIFFKKYLSDYIKTVEINECLNGIILNTTIGKVLALNVYLPYDNNDNESMDNYRGYLATICSVIEEYNITNIAIAGDFNADPVKGRFWKELKVLIDNFNLETEVNLITTNEPVFTFLSAAHSTTSWLDHVLMSNSLFEICRNVFINYDLSLFDHFPLCFSFNLDLNLNSLSSQNNNINVENFVKWHKMMKSDFMKYEENVKKHLNNVDLSSDYTCNITDIDCMFNDIIDILLESSQEFTNAHKSYPKCIPGWNDHLKHLYVDARNKFKSWKNNGMQIPSESHDMMKESRQIFKKQFKKCKRNEDEIRKEKLISSLHNKDNKNFWRNVKNTYNKSDSLKCCTIDNLNSVQEQVDKFSDIFKDIFHDPQSNNSTECKFELFDECNNLNKPMIPSCTIEDVNNAMNRLKCGIGPYNIHTNHLKNSPIELRTYLCKFFNACLYKSYVPKRMIKGVILPLIKDKFGDINSSQNYRPIISSSIILKLFEYILFFKLETYFITNDGQHGFKAGHSIATANFILRETILS